MTVGKGVPLAGHTQNEKALRPSVHISYEGHKAHARKLIALDVDTGRCLDQFESLAAQSKNRAFGDV